MAMLFGIQLLSTLIIGLFMSKIFSTYSYSLMIFYSLWFSVPPVAEYLGTFSQVYKDHMKKKPKNGEKKQPLEEFTIPKDSDLKIRTNKIISQIQIAQVPRVDEIDIVILLTISSVLIYIVTELAIFLGYTPATDIHLSYVWSTVVMVFCFKFLGHMVKVYLQLGGGERSLCAISVFAFITSALLVSMASKDVLDFGIEEGYAECTEKFVAFANSTQLKGAKNLTMPSVKAFKGILIILSGLIGTLITFPSIRLGCLHNRLLRGEDEEENKTTSLKDRLGVLLVHFNLLTPLLVSLCWCKPLVRDHIKSQVSINDATFDLLRTCFVIFTMLVRMLSIKLYLQTHLNSASHFLRNMRREAGRIDHKKVQAKIAYTFQYSGVLILQILTPCIVVLQLCFIMLSLQNSPQDITISSSPHSPQQSIIGEALAEVVSDSVLRGFRSVFTTKFIMSVSSYFTWWIVTSSSVVSMFSLGYYHVSEAV